MTPPTTMLSPVTTGTPRQAPSPHAYDVGLLVLRLALGLTMAAHGSQKLFGWFGGGGLDGTAQFFTASGYPAGKAMAVVAGLTETFGGLGLAVGLLTPLAGAAVVGTMLNALAVKWSGAFFAPEGVEYEVVLIAAAAALTLTGAGGLAVDRLVPGLRAQRFPYGVAALVIALVLAGVTLLLRK
ncbi:DoxX family membrane protein [Streptomyces sp. 21So2-11]|uniref:DoxX family protein n=1 Tax=Streptomyces sp. 21So2-11 TaxID=3144408 RepID=UPI0032191A44